MKKNLLDGPIPGENYTSDTKNYPWHRPPEYKDIDKAMDAVGKRLLKRKSAMGILSMIEGGVDIATITQMFLMSGVGAGKWTVDFAILLAGPTARLIELMAKGYEIEYNLGIDEEDIYVPTKALFDFKKRSASKGKTDSALSAAKEEFETIKADASESQGFMSMGAEETTEQPKGFM